MRVAKMSAVCMAALSVGITACSSSGGHRAAGATPGVPVSGTLPHSSVPLPPTVATTTAPATPGGSSASTVAGATSGTVDVPGVGTYALTVTPSGGQGPCPTPGLGGRFFGFKVSVTNRSAATVPLARVAVSVSDPSSAGREVAALSYSGRCIDFTEPGGSLAANQTVSYQGTASGVSSSSVIKVDVISTPANDNLGSVSLTVGGGA